MSVRDKENWRMIMRDVAPSSHELAKFVLGDLVHYQNGRSWEGSDLASLSNLISCLFEDACEAQPAKQHEENEL